MNRISKTKLAIFLPALLLGWTSAAPAEIILLGVDLKSTAHVEYTPNDGEAVNETVTDSSDTFTFDELGNFGLARADAISDFRSPA